MHPTRIAVSGSMGRMGREIIRMALDRSEYHITGGLENRSHPCLGEDLGMLVVGRRLGVNLESDPKTVMENAQVLVDFSHAKALPDLLKAAASLGVAVVSGVTGLDHESEQALDHASKTVPVLWSSNMSVGVNLLLELMKRIPEVLGEEFDMEIVELHHRHKKDAPSGTSLALAKTVPGRKIQIGRNNESPARVGNEIVIHSLRLGEIVGEHHVHFTGPFEGISLTHRAYQRAVFAQGALRACQWIKGRPPGRYTMAEVLGSPRD